MKHLWEVKHNYYCEEGSYFNTAGQSTIHEFGSFPEFLVEMADADLDMNLLFRWDWHEGDDHDLGDYNGDDNYRHAHLLLFFMHQRKGFKSTSLIQVCRADEPEIIKYLKPRFDYLRALWAPFDEAKPIGDRDE